MEIVKFLSYSIFFSTFFLSLKTSETTSENGASTSRYNMIDGRMTQVNSPIISFTWKREKLEKQKKQKKMFCIHWSSIEIRVYLLSTESLCALDPSYNRQNI